MRRLLACFGAVLSISCAGLLGSTEPGTPGGGPYCSKLPQDSEAQCYPSEAARAQAWKQREAAARPAGQVDAEQAQLAAIVAGQQERERLRAIDAQQKETERQERAAKRERFEAERAQKEQVTKDRSAEVARMATDKVYAVPAISAIMCTIDAEMADDRALLDREKRVAAIGGATDLRGRHELSSELVDDADELKVWRTALRRFGGSQVPCKDLSSVISCRESALRECDDFSRNPAAVWYEQFETLWGLPDKPHRGR